jgi:predicted transcriptional regulator
MKDQNEILPVVVAIRLTDDDMSKLNQLTREAKRTRSNFLRWLVNQEYERQFKSKQSTYNQPTAD